MFALYVIALLCLMSVGHSAPLACEDLVRPLDHLDLHLEGTWALVAGSMSDAAHQEHFKSRDSATINFTNKTMTRAFSLNETCHYGHSNITLEGSSFSFDQHNLTVTFLHTSCQDCLVMRFDNAAKKLVRLYLFSRKREVEQKEMDEFRAQAECLNMLSPVFMDLTKALCPEQISSDPAAQTEEKTEGQKA